MTFCVVIGRRLVSPKCPIAGKCSWAHRVTGNCKYSVENQSLPIAELAELVGEEKPTEAEIVATRERIRQLVIEELR